MNKPDSDVSRSSSSVQPSRFIIALLSIVGLAITPTLSFAVAVATSFEWSMPDRLLENIDIAGADPADPIPKYDPTALLLPPDGWLVNFDACAIVPGIVSYEWFVDGVSVGAVTTCTFSYKFPDEDTYQVSLEVTYDNDTTELFEQNITVQDWLIIALGDSYASGEGNPEKPVTEIERADFSALINLVDNVKLDLQVATEALLGGMETKEVKQTVRDEALATLDQAAADLAVLQADLNELLVIQTNVENDPTVIDARNKVDSIQGEVDYWTRKISRDQQAYNNCDGFWDCAGKLATLESSKLSLDAARARLVTAKATLLAVRTAAIIVYSALETYSAFTDLLADAQAAVDNFKTNTFDVVELAYQNAEDALQDAIDAIISLQSIVDDFLLALEEAKTNAVTRYLDHLPAWISTPPSWAGEEPTYTEIVFEHKMPGEAMRCHRSMVSGQARAALAIEQADPHTSVTFVHLSCSGAKIDLGLVQGYGAQSPAVILQTLIDEGLITGITLPDLPNIAPQVCAAAETVRDREVDAIVTSIGGNDLGFADIVTQCVTGEPCHDPEALPPSEEFTEAQILAVEQNCSPGGFINFLTGSSLPTGVMPFTSLCLNLYDSTVGSSTPGEALETFKANKPVIDVTHLDDEGKPDNRWNDLNTKFEQQFPALDSSRIYFTEYPDPTSDDFGNYCSWNPSQTTTLGEELKGLPGVTESELYWADHTVAASLRGLTQAAADFYQWAFITETEGDQTISSESKNHGYCADDHWVVTLPESLLNQNDHLGVVHPNRSGHEVYKRAIYTKLYTDFYPSGLGGAPRAPDSTQIAPPLACDLQEPAATGGSSSGGSPSPLLLLFLSTCWYMRKIRIKGKVGVLPL